MGSSDVVALALATLSCFQAVALAWIGLRQAQVKRELERVNGRVVAQLDGIERELHDLPR